MDLTETQVESTVKFAGKIVTVRLDVARLPNGALAAREVVEHPGGVAILPLDADGSVTVVQQYRYPFSQLVTELPAGKLERGENPGLCAARELEEEVGLRAHTLTYLGCLYASPGFCDEVLHMYLAQGLEQGDCHPDEDEFLQIQKMPFERLIAEIMAGEIVDAKTVATALKVKTLLGR